MSVTATRMEQDEFALLGLIKSLSRFRACRARNEVLASEMRWNVKRVQRVLGRLEDGRRVQVVTGRPELRGDRWARSRTIYIVSGADREKGALLVANLTRARGKTNHFSDEAACGQLRCTPSQFKEWLDAACTAGFVKVWHEDDGRRVIERIGKFPALDLPNRYCEDRWEGPPARPDLKAKILELVASRTKVTALGTTIHLPTTDTELAKFIGGSRTYAQELTKALITEGTLYSWWKDGKRHLSTTPPPPGASLWRLARNSKVETILKLLGEAPRTTSELASALQLKKVPPYTMKKLRAAGVESTQFGHQRVLSRGPLPAAYVDEVRGRQRRAKARRAAERRRLARLGVDRNEAQLVENAIGEIEAQFLSRYGVNLLRDEESRVAAWAREFQTFVTFERALVVFKEMKAAGQSTDTTSLANQCLHRYLNAWSTSRPQEAA